MARKAGPKPVGNTPFNFKVYAEDEKFIKTEMGHRGLTGAVVLRELIHLGVIARTSELKASYVLTKSMREAQRDGMRSVFGEIREELVTALREAAQDPRKGGASSLPAASADPGPQLLAELQASEKRLQTQFARQTKLAQETNRRLAQIWFLLQVQMKLIFDYFATSFSLFKFNGWKRVREEEPHRAIYQDVLASLNLLVSEKETEVKNEQEREA